MCRKQWKKKGKGRGKKEEKKGGYIWQTCSCNPRVAPKEEKEKKRERRGKEGWEQMKRLIVDSSAGDPQPPFNQGKRGEGEGKEAFDAG